MAFRYLRSERVPSIERYERLCRTCSRSELGIRQVRADVIEESGHSGRPKGCQLAIDGDGRERRSHEAITETRRSSWSRVCMKHWSLDREGSVHHF